MESAKGSKPYQALLAYFDTSSGIKPTVCQLPPQLQEQCTTRASYYKVKDGVICPPSPFLGLHKGDEPSKERFWLVVWLVMGFNGPLRQYYSLYRAVSQREGKRGKKGQIRVKMSKQPPPAPTASAVGPCPAVIKIVGRTGTGSLPSTERFCL